VCRETGKHGFGDQSRGVTLWLSSTEYADAVSHSAPGLLPAPRLNKLPDKLIGVSAPVRKGLRAKFHALLHRCRQRTSLRVVALGQRLRHFADHLTATLGQEHGERVRHWFQDKKAGWYAVLADPKMPASSTLLDQAHNAIDRKLFAMKGSTIPVGVKQRFSRAWRTCTTSFPISAEPCMRGTVGGSGRRASTHTRLDAQPANPDLGRVSVRGGKLRTTKFGGM